LARFLCDISRIWVTFWDQDCKGQSGGEFHRVPPFGGLPLSVDAMLIVGPF
jgi:hypothetical protein